MLLDRGLHQKSDETNSHDMAAIMHAIFIILGKPAFSILSIFKICNIHIMFDIRDRINILIFFFFILTGLVSLRALATQLVLDYVGR